MRSRVSGAALLLLAGCGSTPDLPPPPLVATSSAVEQAPRATAGNGEDASVDEVGYASWYGDEVAGRLTASGTPFRPDAITAAHRTLPLGSHAEVTALDTGRTVLVLVADRGPGGPDRIIDLSRGAAAELGVSGTPLAPVRVRAAEASPADRIALAAGRPAARRLAEPPGLLAALRRRLPNRAPPRVVAMVTAPTRSPVPAAPSGDSADRPYLVQVAAFSSGARARALARALNGSVSTASGFYRVRLGPFADVPAARRARDAAAARGYGDARIIRPDQPSNTEHP